MDLNFKNKHKNNKSKIERLGVNFKGIKTDSNELAKKEKPILEKRFIKVMKYNDIHYQNIITLKADFDIPEKGELIKVRVQKSYNAYTFILAILEKHEVIDELTIISFNINEKTILSVFNLIKNHKVKKFTLIISHTVTQRMPKRKQFLKDIVNENRHIDINVYFAWNHAKMALIKCGSDYYVIEGSGNFTQNAEVEQYVFENNEESYNFDMNNLIPEIVRKCKEGRGEIL